MLDFSNHRNKQGTIIRYEVYKRAFKLTNILFKGLNLTIFENIIKETRIEKKLLLSTLKKDVFGEFSNNNIYTYTANKICEEKLNQGSRIIKLDYLSYYLLKENKTINTFDVKITNNSILKLYKNIILNHTKYKNNKKIYYYNFQDNNLNKIGVKYEEGLENKIINDLFWVKKKSDHKNIILYFEDKSDLKNLLNNTDDLNYLKKNSYHKNTNIKENIQSSFSKTNNFKLAINRLLKLKTSNEINFFIKNYLIDFLIESNRWRNFFLNNKIKINHEFSIASKNIFIKYFVMNNLNGMTATSLRSYPRNCQSLNFNWHCSNILFVSGIDAHKKFLNSVNTIDHIIEIGSYIKIKRNIDKKLKKVLIIDNIHSNNNNQNQVILTKDLEYFYNQIVNTLDKHNIGFDIRTKKKSYFNKLNLNIDTIKKINVSDNFDSLKNLNNNYSLIISISFFYPGVIKDYIINDFPCLVYDYSGFSIIDKSIFDNKFVFRDIDKLIIHLNHILKSNNIDTNYGFLRNKKIDLSSFNDFNGGGRMADYFKYFLNSKLIYNKDIIYEISNILKKKWNNNSS